MTPNPEGEKNFRPRNALVKWVLRLLLGAVVVGLLLLQRGTVAQLLATLSRTSPWVYLASVAFYLLGQALCAWKWQLLLRGRGFKVDLGSCVSIYLAGMFANLWLPTNIGGDALRVARLMRETNIGSADAFASVLLDRLTGFAALIALALVALVANGAAQGQWRLIAVSLALLVTITGVFLALPRIAHPKVQRIGEAVRAYTNHPSTLAAAMLLSLAFQASQIVLNFALAYTLELHRVSFVEMAWIGPALSLSGLLPLGIGGLGTREVAAVALLGRLGVPSGSVIGWSLLWQATTWGASLPGALFLRGGPAARLHRTN